MRAKAFSPIFMRTALWSLGDSNPHRFWQQRHVPGPLATSYIDSPCGVWSALLRGVRGDAVLPQVSANSRQSGPR